MYANRLALTCLALSALCGAGAARAASLPVVSAGREVAVSLRSYASTPSPVISSLRRELETMMASAGYRLQWNPVVASDYAYSVDVEIRGACGIASHASAVEPVSGVPLASSAAKDGFVLPHTWVNCDSVQALLAPYIADAPAARRDYLTGRAVARLIAHEFYHVLAQSRSHAAAGLAKESLSAAELLSESVLFEKKTAQEMRSSPGLHKSAVLAVQ